MAIKYIMGSANWPLDAEGYADEALCEHPKANPHLCRCYSNCACKKETCKDRRSGQGGNALFDAQAKPKLEEGLLSDAESPSEARAQVQDPRPGGLTDEQIKRRLDNAHKPEPPRGDSSAEPRGTKSMRAGDQPLPTKGEALSVQDLCIFDAFEMEQVLATDSAFILTFDQIDMGAICEHMRQRKRVGVERYGTLLLPHNGRDAVRDAFEEAIDGLFYLKQAIVERTTALLGQEHTLGECAKALREKLQLLEEAYRAQWRVVVLLQLGR